MRPLNQSNKTSVMRSLFDNVYQNSLDKLVINSEEFKISSKPIYTAPVITREFTDEDGVEQYELENGNTIPQEKYNNMWYPKKTSILPKGTKGDNPDKTKI